MRDIKFVKSKVAGCTKIFVDGVEMETRFDDKAMTSYRINRLKLPPIYGQQIIDLLIKKLNNDHVNFTKTEIAFIVDYAKSELGIF